jgi:hypothetical protein
MSKFPHKKSGDSLEASHVNDLSSAARQVVGIKVGGNLTKHQGESFLGLYGNPAWHQYTFEITGNVNSSPDGLFKGKIRYWDNVTSTWKTNDTEYQIDTTDSDATFAIGDKVVAYWDKQRVMFLPCNVPHTANQFYNDSGETVPIAAVMAVTGVHTLDDGTVIPKISKPSSTPAKSYLLNGATEVPVADAEADPPTTGIGTYQDSDFRDVLALYDTGTPAVDEEWGPDNGVWGLRKGSVGDGASGTTILRADWGILVYGIADSTNKVLLGRVVSKGRARMCLCQAKISSGHTLATVDTITSMDGGWCPVASATDTLSVDSGFTTDDNAVGVIVYNETTNTWRPLDFPCPT